MGKYMCANYFYIYKKFYVTLFVELNVRLHKDVNIDPWSFQRNYTHHSFIFCVLAAFFMVPFISKCVSFDDALVLGVTSLPIHGSFTYFGWMDDVRNGTAGRIGTI